MNQEQAFKDEIDNYNDSLFAIIGFMNFYRYDDATKSMRSDVLVFQGRTLTPSEAKSKNEAGETVHFVTPDLGILLPDGKGVLGEVKRSFPLDTARWLDDFKQLMGYDDDLTGWPNDSQKVTAHDIVLLLHQSRAIKVKNYFTENSPKDIHFTRPFSIVEFNRSSQGKEYFFFRNVSGNVSDQNLAARLEEGINVPMGIYLIQYSTVKLYDSTPPLPYLLELIWTHVVAVKVTSIPGYKIPAKKQKVKIELALDEISERLEKNFSFHGLQQGHANARQPRVLKDTALQQACAALVKFGDAEWTDTTKTKLSVNFVKREDVLDYFIKCCAKEPGNNGQMDLFNTKDKGIS
jgi:hypothetical protein